MILRAEGGVDERKEKAIRQMIGQGALEAGMDQEDLGDYVDRVWELMMEDAFQDGPDLLIPFTPHQTTQAIRDLDIEVPWQGGGMA